MNRTFKISRRLRCRAPDSFLLLKPDPHHWLTGRHPGIFIKRIVIVLLSSYLIYLFILMWTDNWRRFIWFWQGSWNCCWTMADVLDGNPEIGAHVWIKICNFTISWHLLRSTAITQIKIFSTKKYLFSFTRAQVVMSCHLMIWSYFFALCLSVFTLYVQEVVTRPQILNRTILSNWIHVT